MILHSNHTIPLLLIFLTLFLFQYDYLLIAYRKSNLNIDTDKVPYFGTFYLHFHNNLIPNYYRVYNYCYNESNS